jgi:hypothetical protein
MRSHRITAVALSVLVVAGSLVALQPGAAYATEPGTDGLLATSSDFGTTIGNADGTGQQVPTPLSSARYATWSSDGSRIAWTEYGIGLAVSDPDGTNQVWIPNTTYAGGPTFGGPTWYDSNTKLVFADGYPSETNAYRTQLFVASVLGFGSKAPLFATDTGCNDSHPLAHGNLIAFTRTCTSTPSQVWLYDKATGTAHKVLDNASDADISPDGTKIVFSRVTSTVPGFLPGDDLFESAIDGSGVTQLTTTGATQSKRHEEPVWSPSGTRIAYYGNGGPSSQDTEIFDMAAKTETVWLAWSWGAPSWQPINPSAPKPPGPPPPLVVVLAASAGAANTSGQTDVTLDASGTTGAGTGASYSFDFGDGQGALVSATPVVTRPEWEGTYRVTVTVTDALAGTATSTPQWLTVGDGYHPVTPTRLLDTRYGVGAPAAAVGSMQTLTLQLPASVTANAYGPLSAVVLNVTVTQPTSYGDIRVYADGLSQRPDTSSLNFSAGLTVANLVTVPILDGKVTLFVESPGSAHLIADLSGYYTAGTSGAGFAPLSPTRILDTRNGTGGVGGRVAAGGTVSLPVPASVPADATAVVMNATAVNTSSFGNLTVYPDVPGQAVPTASNLNFNANGTVPNLVIVSISADRRIDFHVDSAGSADLIADIEGYFSPSATSKFVPWYPTRLFDTRNGDAGGAVQSGWAVRVSMAYGFEVPVSALTAGLYNVTVTQPAGHGYITVFPDGLASVPNVSNLNYSEGQTVPNAVLAPMTDGKEIFYNGGTAETHLIADFFGYFAKPLATDAPPTSALSMAVQAKISAP